LATSNKHARPSRALRRPVRVPISGSLNLEEVPPDFGDQPLAPKLGPDRRRRTRDGRWHRPWVTESLKLNSGARTELLVRSNRCRPPPLDETPSPSAPLVRRSVAILDNFAPRPSEPEDDASLISKESTFFRRCFRHMHDDTNPSACRWANEVPPSGGDRATRPHSDGEVARCAEVTILVSRERSLAVPNGA